MRERFFTILFMMCFVLCAAFAQTEATVKSFTLTTDHIPGNDRRNDLNGTPCALVKVQVVDNIERIEGNKIGEIVRHGVEKWIYMCKGSRNMRIHLANHLPVRVMFQDYQINGLESNRVYELVIEIPDAPAIEMREDNNAMQKFILNYSPRNAIVLVDSKSYRGNGRIELQLPLGEHKYMIVAEGYITVEGVVKLNGQAPRTITETLIAEAPVVGPNGESPAMSDILPSRKNKKNSDNQLERNTIYYSNEGEQANYSNLGEIESVQAIMPPKAINKSFKSKYEGVTFKCKAKNGIVTITGFDVNAENVTIPGKVEFEGNYYPVKEIDTFINGNNYSAKKLVIQDGVMVIANFAFVEFRKLVDVTLPNSISEIGRNAFRNNDGMRFRLPSWISENDLRKGKHIKRR